MRGVLQHREVEVNIVKWREEGQMSGPHLRCVEVRLELLGRVRRAEIDLVVGNGGSGSAFDVESRR